MCFSAPASFIASAGLAVIGTIAISQAKTKPQRMLALIPLIFSVQQFSEGFLWFALSNENYTHLRDISMYTFLAFAQVAWPAYVPLTILMFEKDALRKKLITTLSVLGILTSLYLTWCLFFYPVFANIDGHHIYYDLNFPLANKWYTGITYMFATVAAPLLSGVKRLRYLGALLLLSYIIAQVMYNDYLISVWCYFAALLSIYVLYIIRALNHNAPPSTAN